MGMFNTFDYLSFGQYDKDKDTLLKFWQIYSFSSIFKISIQNIHDISNCSNSNLLNIAFFVCLQKIKQMIKIQHLLILFLFGLIIPNMYAQDERPLWQKLRYLSEEEMNMEVNKNRQLTITEPPTGFIKNVGEYEAMQGVLIRYPLGIPVSLVVEMAKDAEVITLVGNASQKTNAINLYTQNGVNLDNCTFL